MCVNKSAGQIIKSYTSEPLRILEIRKFHFKYFVPSDNTFNNYFTKMASKFRSLTGPYVIEGLRAAGIMGTGDILAQTVVEKTELKNVDWIRTMKYGSLGLLFVGPVLKYWFSLLDRTFRGKQGGVTRTIKKMAVDQVVMAPTMNLAVAGLVGLINSEKPHQISERLKTQYPDIMKTNYMIWPAVQIINFGLVPLRYQVVFVQSVAVFWNCFVSQLLNEKLVSPEVVDKQKS